MELGPNGGGYGTVRAVHMAEYADAQFRVEGERMEEEDIRSWDRWGLQMVSYKLDRNQISLKDAKLHALRLGYDIKAPSKELFLREFARNIRETINQEKHSRSVSNGRVAGNTEISGSVRH